MLPSKMPLNRIFNKNKLYECRFSSTIINFLSYCKDNIKSKLIGRNRVELGLLQYHIFLKLNISPTVCIYSY